MKSEMPFRGVKSPDQKMIFREVVKRYKFNSFKLYINVIEELWDADYREERYIAISLARKFRLYHTLEALDTYEMMIRTGEWWDYVDAIAANLIGSLLVKYSDEIKPLLKQWIVDENIWIRRSAILSQLRLKEQTDKKMLFSFCKKCLHEESFWTRKAIGWALREYSKTEPNSVHRFIQSHQETMSNLTKREASRYLIIS
jgi:3-methyladenine DNA glycosylase AlkD